MLCNGDANGNIELTVNGGTAPYNISWSGAASGNPPGDEVNSSGGNYTMSGLIAGDYDITITDDNGCVLSLTNQTITQPAVLAQSNVSTDVSLDDLQLERHRVQPDTHRGPGTSQQRASAQDDSSQHVAIECHLRC